MSHESYEPDAQLIELVVRYLKIKVTNDPEWADTDLAKRAEADADALYAATARAMIIGEHQRFGDDGVQGLRREMTQWLQRQTDGH